MRIAPGLSYRPRRRTAAATTLLAWMMLLFSGGCAPADPDNSNGDANQNGTANTNANGAELPTVEDLPDLSDDDLLANGEGNDLAVPGLILVGFDTQISDTLFVQLAQSTAAAVGGELLDAVPDIRVVTVRVEPGTEAQAAAVAEGLLDVDYAEANMAGRLAAPPDLIPAANAAEFAQYQLFLTSAVDAREFANAGSGSVTVAVLDSGCLLSHPEFVQANILGGFNYLDADADVNDEVPGGHGTGIVSLLASSVDSGEIAGLLPGFNITVHKVCDGTGTCPLDAVVLGIIGALNGNGDFDITTSEIPPAGVINLSLSFSSDYPSLARAVFEAERRGAVVVGAAGNNGRSEQAQAERYPAGYSTVLSVGASDIADRAAPFSNRAGNLDVVAPGVDILVATADGRYGYVDGTSYAAAQASAAAAWILDREGALETFDVRARLRQRGDTLPAGSGFGATSARRLNFAAALQNGEFVVGPHLFSDQAAAEALGMSTGTLATRQAGSSSAGPTPEAFTEETVYWYGYFPSTAVTLTLIDGEEQRIITPQSVAASTIDLFVEFLRGLSLGELQSSFGIVQQVFFDMPDLGGERRALALLATANGLESQRQTLIYNPLKRGYNVVAYKNFNSTVWHLLEEEEGEFDPGAADITLLGSGPQPVISWPGELNAHRVQLGSSLNPTYYVTSAEDRGDIAPGLKLGDCAGEPAPEQICGEAIGLPPHEIARILVGLQNTGGISVATLDVIYVP